MALKRLYEEYTDSYLETGVGIVYSDTYEMVRAMLIAYGSGSEAVDPETGSNLGQEPIHAGPKGRPVWNDSLSTQHPSEATDHPMPDSFNQVGNMFPLRAIEEVKQVFDRIVQQAMGSIPENVLADCFYQ